MLSSLPKPFGKTPTKSLSARSMREACRRDPSSSGIQPPMPLFMKMISSKFAMFPMLLGMQPLKLLLANTITDAGDFPIVSGIVEVKRLLFTNTASRGFSKSSGGNGPSNSLYLRSRYVKFGSCNTTFGNGPTNRLLLTSNSVISERLLMLSGRTPQNLFELMWNKAISVKRPRSEGRLPAMSPWLRSTPATTVAAGSSKAGAQNTPL